MKTPTGPRPKRGNPLVESIGWCSVLALLPAAGVFAYRRWKRPPETTEPFPPRWLEVLFITGAVGQAAYGRAVGNRVMTAAGTCLAASHGIGLAGSVRSRRERRLTASAPRPSRPRDSDGRADLRQVSSRAFARETLPSSSGSRSASFAGPRRVPTVAIWSDPSMTTHDHETSTARTQEGPPRHDSDAATHAEPDLGTEVVATNDPVITPGAGYASEWQKHPDATMVVKTNRVGEPATGQPPGVVVVPYEEKTASDSPRRDDHDRHSSEPRNDSQGTSGDKDSGKHDDKDRDSSRAQPSMTRILLLSALVALVCGIAGAWGYSYFFGDKSRSDEQKQGSSAGKKSGGSGQGKSGSSENSTKGSNEEQAGSSSNEADTIPGITTAEDSDSLREQIGQLSERFDALQHRLDEIRQPRNQTPPDVHTLQIKMGELSRTIDEVADLPSRVQRLDNQLEDLKQQLKVVRDRETATTDEDLNKPVVALDRELTVIPSSTTGSSASAAAPPPPFTVADAPDAALEQAIELFKLGQYPIAANILSKLRATHGDDARVWYFSAMVEGLTTGQWKDQSQKFAETGVQREREGKPSKAVIDRSLNGVTRTQGGNWLSGFRQRIGKSL